ncbi:MAG: tetratricopeptide repeat protein [Verrucomicrobia bacterium]|nr:tetratricopeptide repeat protein [Verrucomicrobiota bacterium]
MKQSSFFLRIFAAIVIVAGLGVPVSAEIDMQFWKKPGYFDGYYKDLTFVGSKRPTVKSEEQEVLMQFIRELEISEERGLQYLKSMITPQSSSALDFNLGVQYYKADDIKNAQRYFQNAVRKWPTFQAAYKLLGYCCLQGEDWTNAAAAFSRATALGEDDAKTYGLLGMIYLNQEKILESESAYKKAIIADPGTLDWYKGLAQTLVNQGKHLELVSLFEEMIDQAPDAEAERDFLLMQSNSFIALNQNLNAAANYEIVRRMGLGNADSMGRLGDIYLNENQVELATEAYVESIELDPEQSQDIPVNSATIMVSRGFWKNGQVLIDVIRKVFAKGILPENHLTLLRLEAQVALGEQMDSAIVIGFLEEILELEPEDGQTLLLLAKFAASREDIEESRKYYEQVIELEEYEYEGLIQYAQMLGRRRLYCDAVPLLRDALDVEYTTQVEVYLDNVERACRRQRLGRR